MEGRIQRDSERQSEINSEVHPDGGSGLSVSSTQSPVNPGVLERGTVEGDGWGQVCTRRRDGNLVQSVHRPESEGVCPHPPAEFDCDTETGLAEGMRGSFPTSNCLLPAVSFLDPHQTNSWGDSVGVRGDSDSVPDAASQPSHLKRQWSGSRVCEGGAGPEGAGVVREEKQRRLNVAPSDSPPEAPFHFDQPLEEREDAGGGAGQSKGEGRKKEGGRAVKKKNCHDTLCAHSRLRSTCKECRRRGICEHGRQRCRCKECGGTSLCEHGRERTRCKDCGGTGLCGHGRIPYNCKDCGGKGICEHGRQRTRCKDCGGKGLCEHGRQRYNCKECGGRGVCEHGKLQSGCKNCRASREVGMDIIPLSGQGRVARGVPVSSAPSAFESAESSRLTALLPSLSALSAEEIQAVLHRAEMRLNGEEEKSSPGVALGGKGAEGGRDSVEGVRSVRLNWGIVERKGFCEHNRERYRCKDCGGKGLCEHNRERYRCKDCGGKGICEHGRVRSACKECRGGSVCGHGRERSKCKECGGGGICQHGRERSKCKDCGGGGICQHGKRRTVCKECGGGSLCEHGRERCYCKACVGGSMCKDGRQRSKGKECGGRRLCEHGREHRRCKACGGWSFCEHGRERYRCKDCTKTTLSSYGHTATLQSALSHPHPHRVPTHHPSPPDQHPSPPTPLTMAPRPPPPPPTLPPPPPPKPPS